MADTLIFDLDGTLLDTNYQHAIAWYRAFRRHDMTVPIWQIHRALGMGGDQLVAAVTDDDVERRLGDDLRAAWGESSSRRSASSSLSTASPICGRPPCPRRRHRVCKFGKTGARRPLPEPHRR
jgi:beta-phosphoglucomutase-like phosphatase (HAD superfamily)